MLDWLDSHGINAVIAGLLAIIAWNIRRFVATLDGHGQRLTALEKDRVTRADFDELRSSLTATATNNQMRTESRLDRIFEHLAGTP